MKKPLLLVVLFSALANAEPYPQQDLAALVSPEGFHFDRAIEMVKTLHPLAGGAITHFDSDADRERARRDIQLLAEMLELVRDDNLIGPDQPERPQLLWLLAQLGVYGHNLGLEDGRARARSNFEAVLKLVPASEGQRRAALLEDYGRFLTAATEAAEGEKYLREARELNPDAALALVENLLMQGKKTEALRLLADHRQAHPEDEAAQRIEKALQDEGNSESPATSPGAP